MRCALVVASALTLVACSRGGRNGEAQADPDYSGMQRVTLPGFSLDMPEGEVLFASDSPTVGAYKIKPRQVSLFDHFVGDMVRNRQFTVHWTTQTSSREEWEKEYLPMYVNGLATAVPGSKVLFREALNADRWFAMAGAQRAPVSLAVVRCDPRFEVALVFSQYHEMELQVAFTRKVLRSVRCEVTDRNRAGLLAAVNLPNEFGTVPAAVGQHFQSLTGELLMVNFTTGRIPADPKILRTVIHTTMASMDDKVLASALVALDPPPDMRGQAITLTRARMPTLEVEAYVGSRFCEPEGATLVFIWMANAVSDELAWRRHAQVGCPGEKVAPLREFKAMAEEACATGDSGACDLRNELPQG